jgi:hypothetical protein
VTFHCNVHITLTTSTLHCDFWRALLSDVAIASGQACQQTVLVLADNKKTRIIPRHVQLAIRNDEELSRLLSDVTIASGGVLPNIHSVLLPTQKSKKAAE